MTVPTIAWKGELPGVVELIDQTLLPTEVVVRSLTTHEEMWEAIQSLRIRGAPAIGIAAAFGLVLGVQHVADPAIWESEVERVALHLKTARPTAVNLSWALERMQDRVRREKNLSLVQRKKGLLEEARRILHEDREICRRIGRHGAALIKDGCSLLTHCNAGGLATSGYGTALAVCYAARDLGRTIRVFADETRPLLQGARLTAWELQQAGIDVTLICDSMAGVVLQKKKVDLVLVGADRIARNGDTANKIGTYSVAVLARSHQVPFYVAAPISTFDRTIENGDQIPIEERAAEEITEGFGRRTAPPLVKTFNPAFDATPHELIAGIITEHGVIDAPSTERIDRFFAAHHLEPVPRSAPARRGSA